MELPRLVTFDWLDVSIVGDVIVALFFMFRKQYILTFGVLFKKLMYIHIFNQ